MSVVVVVVVIICFSIILGNLDLCFSCQIVLFQYHMSIVVVVIIRFSIIHLFTRLLFKWKARLVSIPHLNHLPLSQISEQLFHSKTILPGCFEITSPF